MLTEFLQDRAILYVSGEMAGRDRAAFEVLMEFVEGLRKLVDDLTLASAQVCSTRPDVLPSPGAKAKLMRIIAKAPQETKAVARVVSGPDGLVRWVNAPFSEMCGYSLAELQGKKLGPILQGKETDPAAAARLRQALREGSPCHESLINYHKDGHPYRVDIAITPILDDDDRPVWLVATEKEMD